MGKTDRSDFSELKVGIFVLVCMLILGLAIFTIGTQVGLLQQTFYAKTYLNNVSGLKAGNITLMAGVEAGNVIAVEIQSGKVPDTQANQYHLEIIDNLNKRIDHLQKEFLELKSTIDTTKAKHNEITPLCVASK